MTDWHARAREARFDGRALIDGKRCDAVGGETFVKSSPIDGRTLGPVARCREADIDAAVKSARAAFNDGRWAGKPPELLLDRRGTLPEDVPFQYVEAEFMPPEDYDALINNPEG